MKVAFIGHRTIDQTKALREKLTQVIEKLIAEEDADTFLFGSKSDFNDLCYGVVTAIRARHEKIRRVFVRAEYETIGKSYMDYLMNRERRQKAEQNFR